ncbi:cell division protein FtsQ/DivIB [Nitriliruptor alkaliphilus]|uniref:cell division protein FtsQ/DivIB n=1 Tax=Nitriliruptor alkaliphilus TaxID=427918 RepID=UPI0006977A68|nr:FtsQ-type POTRA domain-containing protein [Nitriliruptor alkaliphilus]
MTAGAPPPGDRGSGGRIDDRIAERRREVRRERQVARRRRTLTTVGVVLLLVAIWAVERSPLVGLESIEVVGTDRLTEDDVLEAVDLELGTSTLRLRLGRVEERVEALALVATADARRLDPLRVRIEVVERVPVLVARGDGRELLVDRTGLVLAPGSVDGLPAVRLAEAPPPPGERGPDRGPLAEAVTAWRGLSGPLRAEVVRYDAREAGELDLELRSGVTVRFGRAERIDEKVRALGAVLEDVGDTPVSTIDVRAPARPVVVP